MIAILSDWLVGASWKGSLLLLVTLAVLTLFRKYVPPQWRHALLLIAMLRLVMPVAPEARFSIFNLAPRPVVNEATAITAAPLEAPVRAFEVRVHPSPAPSATPTRHILLGIWLAGAVGLLSRMLWQTVRLHRRVRKDGQARLPVLHTLLEQCRQQLGVRTPIRVQITSAVSSPSLHGIIRPTLLLPAGVPFGPDQLRFIFLHELAHFRRSDVLLNWFTTAVAALHWFNPLVWLAATRVAEERELACDALALAALDRGDRAAYGQTVIQLLDELRSPPMVPAVVGMATTKHQAKRRIEMIATFRNESRRTVWFAVAVAAVALVTLTDANATADEPKRTFKRVLLDVSPEGQAFIAQLEGKMTLTLDNATIEEIINAVSNATGASIKVAEGAFTEATRDARLKLTAKNIPAHIVLNESLSAVGLGLRFAEDGITVVTLPEDHERTAEVFIRKMEGAPAAAGEPRRFRVIQGDEIELQNGERVIVKQRKLNRAEANVEATTDGVQRRKVKLTDENNVEGTLEIEVKK